MEGGQRGADVFEELWPEISAHTQVNCSARTHCYFFLLATMVQLQCVQSLTQNSEGQGLFLTRYQARESCSYLIAMHKMPNYNKQYMQAFSMTCYYQAYYVMPNQQQQIRDPFTAVRSVKILLLIGGYEFFHFALQCSLQCLY